MTKTKKQKRQEAGLEPERKNDTAQSMVALAFIMALIVGLIFLLEYIFPSFRFWDLFWFMIDEQVPDASDR